MSLALGVGSVQVQIHAPAASLGYQLSYDYGFSDGVSGLTELDPGPAVDGLAYTYGNQHGLQRWACRFGERLGYEAGPKGSIRYPIDLPEEYRGEFAEGWDRGRDRYWGEVAAEADQAWAVCDPLRLRDVGNNPIGID